MSANNELQDTLEPGKEPENEKVVYFEKKLGASRAEVTKAIRAVGEDREKIEAFLRMSRQK